MTRRRHLWHGGAPGMTAGQTIRPNQQHRKHIDGCSICEAKAAGAPTIDPGTPEGWVYATSNRAYAKFYASSFPFGTLYTVTLVGPTEKSIEDSFPTWRASKARVVAAVETRVKLTMTERARLFVAWGGTVEEFDSMVAAVGADRY